MLLIEGAAVRKKRILLRLGNNFSTKEQAELRRIAENSKPEINYLNNVIITFCRVHSLNGWPVMFKNYKDKLVNQI